MFGGNSPQNSLDLTLALLMNPLVALNSVINTSAMITPDPFGEGTYNLQSISATMEKKVWGKFKIT